MDSGLHIDTTQNVSIRYEPAGIGNRILATLLDNLFKIAYIIVLGLILYYSRLMDHVGNDLETIIVFILILPLMFYGLVFEIFMQGQTPGKRIMKIRVVKTDGSQAGFSSYLIRWLFRIVDFQIMSGLVALITALVTERQQRLGDLAAGTNVILLKQKIKLEDTILSKANPDYKVYFPQVSLLNDKDITIIKEVLSFATKNNDSEALLKLANRIKEKTGINSDMKPEPFIKAVLMDYSAIQFEDN